MNGGVSMSNRNGMGPNNKGPRTGRGLGNCPPVRKTKKRKTKKKPRQKGEHMKEKLAKLIDVKTIVTFSLIGTVVYLAVTGNIEPKDIIMMTMVTLTFYFTKKKDA